MKKLAISLFLLVVLVGFSFMGNNVHITKASDLIEVTPAIQCRSDDLENQLFGYGTGSIIGKNKEGQLLILSVKHVILGCVEREGARLFLSLVNGEEVNIIPLDVAKVSEDLDLVLLKTEAKFTSKFKYLTISDKIAEPGDKIYISGYPRPFTVPILLVGHIASTILTGWDSGELVYIFTPNINFGSSGSPILNEKFEIIGLAYSMIVDPETPFAMAIGVRSDQILRFLKEE